jgi:hypothetical protein
MQTSIVKLVAAFVMAAAMVGCASTGGSPISSNDLVYDPAFTVG